MQRSGNESTQGSKRAKTRPKPLRAQAQSSESQFRGSVRETSLLWPTRGQTGPNRGPNTGPKQVRVRTPLWSLTRRGMELAGPNRNLEESSHSCNEWSNVEPVLKSLGRVAMAWESPPVQNASFGQGSGVEILLLDSKDSPALSLWLFSMKALHYHLGCL